MNTCEKYFSIIDNELLKAKYNVDELSIELTPNMVNPVNDTIEDDNTLNTKLIWWIEVKGYSYKPDEDGCNHSHIWELDCRGDSAEGAIEALYNIIEEVVNMNYKEGKCQMT